MPLCSLFQPTPDSATNPPDFGQSVLSHPENIRVYPRLGNTEQPIRYICARSSLCKKKKLACIYSKKLQRSLAHRSLLKQEHGDTRVRQHGDSLKSNVREAIVRIMTFTPPKRTVPGANEKINHGLASDSNVCSFWFAVAMGGLLQGRPKEAVRTYMKRTKAAANAYSKVPTPELTRVWIQIAVMKAFCGDLDGYRDYVDRAHSLVHDLHLRGSLDQMQPSLLEMVKHFKVLQLLIGQQNSQEDLDIFINSDVGPTPQVGNMITLKEMARFSRHAFHRHGQAVLADALVNLNKGGRKVQATKTAGRQHFKEQQNQCLEEPHVGRKVEQLRQELSLIYEQLENATKRQINRSGIVLLMFNVPFCIMRIARHDRSGAVEVASRVTEQLLRYPGLIRFDLWGHVCHIMLTVLLTLESAELFERLRVGYNEYRSRGPTIPPVKEWKGLEAYCNNLFCRGIQQEFREKLQSRIQPEISDDGKGDVAGTASSSGERDTAVHQPLTNSCMIEQKSPYSTMKDKKLRYDSTLEVERMVDVEVKKGTLDNGTLRSCDDCPDKAAILLGGLDSPYEKVGVDVLRPEDWDIVNNALLEDITNDVR